jgi:hypothetical protein
MFLQAFEFGNIVSNVLTYNDTARFKRDSVSSLTDSGAKKITGKSIGFLRRKLEEENNKRRLKGLSLLLLALPLSACGGSDEPEVVALPEVTGRAIDGYLVGSTVFLKNNPDVTVATSGELGSQGNFGGLFGTGSIVVQQGTDIATGKAFTGELRAPEGATVITPITTLVEAVVAAAEDAGLEPISAELASQQVAKGLGLSSTANILETDFVATGSAGMAKAAAQVASVIAVVTASAGSEVSAAVLSNIAAKVAKAGEVGGKAKVLTDATELTSVFIEVIETDAELFEDAPEGLDLNVFAETVSSSVAEVNVKVEEAESLLDIVATQQLVQDDLVTAFTIDLEDGEEFDAAAFASSVTELSENLDAKLEETAAELDVYLATEDLGFDLTVELDFSDADADAVEIDLDIIDGAIEGTIDEALVTGFIFGDVDETILDGVLDGSIDAESVTEILEALPEYEVFPDDIPVDVDPVVPVVEVPVVEVPVVEVPVVEVPIVEVPVVEVPVVEVPEEVVEIIPGGGGGSVSSAGTTYAVDSAMNIQAVINSAAAGDTIQFSAGRYDQSFTVNKDISLIGANFGIAISADGSDSDSKVNEVSEVAFDVSDSQRTGGSAETWINGTVNIASDGVTMDGFRLHSYNGPLEFSGSDIDNFALQNTYVTGFAGSKSVRYIDNDGTSSTGWSISNNLIGGVAGGVGGSFYLDGVTNSSIEDNVFWRPGAGHMYLTDVSNITVKDNFFVQGLHADGANSDALLDDLVAKSEWGYVGFSGGQGYGNLGGYGYGFGYGYSGSGPAITSMGYGYGSEGGYGPSGYFPDGYGINNAGGGGGTSKIYHGRNFAVEVKGDASNVTFSGNTGKYNSGGIQFWDENNSANVFSDIHITNNTFTDMQNADPDGFLSSVASRHKSGLMGGVTYSVVDGSTSSGLTITGNTFTGSINQIHNNNDIDSLILVQGEVDTVNISSNTLSWKGSSLSDTASSLTGGTDSDRGAYKVYTQGIHLAGDVNAGGSASGLVLQNNTFDTDDAHSTYISDGILIDGTNQYHLDLGMLQSDVYIVDNDHSTYSAYVASNDFGGYKTASDDYAPVSVAGGSHSLQSSSTANPDILYSQVDIV